MRMTEHLRNEVAEALWNAIDSRSGDPIGVVIHMSDHLFPREGEGEIDAAKGVCRDIADAAIAIVLERCADLVSHWPIDATDDNQPKEFRMGAEWACKHLPFQIRALQEQNKDRDDG